MYGPLWPIEAKGIACIGVDLDDTCMFKACTLKPESLTACACAKFE